MAVWMTQAIDPSISTAQPGRAPEPVNLAQLASVRAMLADTGCADLFGKLVSIFLRDAPPLLIALSNAVEGGGLPEVRTTAHKLKGMCSQVAANRMTEICTTLQSAQPPQARGALADLVTSLRDELPAVCDTLRRAAAEPVR